MVLVPYGISTTAHGTTQMLPTQMFGEVELPTGKRHLMLCRDVDKMGEVMLHHFHFAKPPGGGAILCSVEQRGVVLTIRPKVIFVLGEDGKSIYAPPKLSDEQLRWTASSVLTMTIQGNSWSGTLSDPEGKTHTVTLQKGAPFSFRQREPTRLDSWPEFKDWVARTRSELDAVSFRGHGSDKFSLRTSFHRAGLQRIERFTSGLMEDFRRHAEAVLNERLDMKDPDEFATLIALAQHHGLPTPMLDWTGSPYIAAFFAFADYLQESASRQDVEFVRVYALSRWFVEANRPSMIMLAQAQPYIEYLEVSPRKNPRLYAQRGQFLVTNVEDIEAFVSALENVEHREAIRCVDLPVRCASEALEDLEFMGLSAAALFPGLDGVCRMLRHQITYRRANIDMAPNLADTRDSGRKQKQLGTASGAERPT